MGAQVMKNNDFVTIAVVYGQIKAEVFKSHLESEGIPVYLQYESLGMVTGITIDGLGKIKVKVPAECAEGAKQILEQTNDEAESDQP
jgi:NhaP-type Na+/H+ and K+/H+ antiporter